VEKNYRSNIPGLHLDPEARCNTLFGGYFDPTCGGHAGSDPVASMIPQR
jgi:hypothetical protein